MIRALINQRIERAQAEMERMKWRTGKKTSHSKKTKKVEIGGNNRERKSVDVRKESSIK